MNNKISKYQFISLMLINDVFALFCLSGNISVTTAVGFAVGIAVQLLLAIPLILVYRKGRTISECGKFAEVIVLLAMVLWGGMLFSMIWNTGELVFVPFEEYGKWGRYIITAFIVLVCVYVSSSGIKALARSAVIASVLGAICVAIAVMYALMRSDFKNLERAQDTGFFRELIRGFSLSGGLSAAAVILGFVKDSTVKTAVGYFISKIIISAVVIITGVLVCGGIMKTVDFPVAESAQLSQPFPVQRVDALFLIIFTVFAVYSAAVQASASEYILRDTVPKLKKYRCSIILVIMAVLGALFGGKVSYGITFAVIPAIILLLIPISYIIKRKVKP